MNAQRLGLSAFRQVTARQPNTLFPRNVPRLATVAATRSSTLQRRTASTTKVTTTDEQDLLAAQRRNRPLAPHLQIYDKSQTWFGGSAWTRITGATFSGGLYAFAISYLVAPLFGWHLESASLAAAFGALPEAAKGTLKFLVAWPVVFHSANGIRHLTWDLAKGFSRAAIKRGGLAIWAVSTALALGLVFV